ncbi:hypothetical protein FRX31_012206 [Thalictrum thalictroides]|uniref:Uncharacterized protein n=1 Tax=Thalictrum thalictroides TaxID=46969 RepID=A0A7J6WNN3_THATH|nr:hypothetical protein FRX31_012206 [Thalictrum thalictroides]
MPIVIPMFIVVDDFGHCSKYRRYPTNYTDFLEIRINRSLWIHLYFGFLCRNLSRVHLVRIRNLQLFCYPFSKKQKDGRTRISLFFSTISLSILQTHTLSYLHFYIKSHISSSHSSKSEF